MFTDDITWEQLCVLLAHKISYFSQFSLQLTFSNPIVHVCLKEVLSTQHTSTTGIRKCNFQENQENVKFYVQSEWRAAHM